MKYDGILFDLDGTLWNATEPIAVSWAIALKDQPDIERAPSTEELEKVMGMTSEKLMAQLFPYLSYERGQELFQHCCEVEMVYLRDMAVHCIRDWNTHWKNFPHATPSVL